jgi:hypothetical protein
MEKSKQTPADRNGGRTKRQPRDPSPDRRGWNPADDIYGNDQRPVDADLDLEKGKYSKPPPKR